jgi:hypothetical protein
MDLYHQLSNGGIRIVENGGLWYVQYWDAGDKEWYFHEWLFMDREKVFEYIDWCDVYCDVLIHQLLHTK